MFSVKKKSVVEFIEQSLFQIWRLLQWYYNSNQPTQICESDSNKFVYAIHEWRYILSIENK